ncbi:hypothetical protein UY3_16959 [Chelonia mydas]|uniref:Cilia- and flagella-associated protein 74 n=1 Tax=Chelonia mydas TaxID=8469 RepID=M7BCK9_CHEMY|nr:hypothetical protein UY3_16959 [Chelonia mydas]
MEDTEFFDICEKEQTAATPFLEQEKDDDDSVTDQFWNVANEPKGHKIGEESEEDDKIKSKDASEGVGEDFDSSGESQECHVNSGNNNNNKTMKYADRVRILNLRRNLNQLDNIAKEKALTIAKAREELSACQLRIEMLTKERECTETKIEEEKEAGNTAAVFRLQAMHRRLCAELGNEKDLESKIALMLKENMYEMWQIEIEQGKFGSLREQLEQDEEELERQCKERAEQRIQKEKTVAQLAERKQQVGKKKETEAWEAYERRHQKVVDDAHRNHEKAAQFLKKSMSREFTEQQKSRKTEIVARILQEEAYVEKQKKHQAWAEALRSQGKLQDSLRWRIKTWQYIENACEDPAATVLQKSWRTPSTCSLVDDKSSSVVDFSEKTLQDTIHENDDEEASQTLAEPEFTGLWSQECNLYKMPKDETDPKPLGASKMERKIFTENLEKLRSGIIRKQVVSGREFKGCPFYSKPSLIHFKDFDVGKTYKKKIILINASYSVNFCKLVGVSEHLKDFINIHFDPPGQMSAGMSCEVVVTFKPMLALDKELIDFGTHVVGETISRMIILTNRGALGTRFKLQTSAGDNGTCTTTAKSSLERMVGPRAFHQTDLDTPADGITSEEKASSSPVESSIYENKEQVSPVHTEEVTLHISLPESQKTESNLGSSHIELVTQAKHAVCLLEQFSQDALITEADLETENAQSPAEPPPEEELIEITLGKVTEGEIGPFSSIELQIIFTPCVPGDVRAEFEITFDNPNCKPLHFCVIGVSVDVPVWVPNPNVDLKICMYDRLYQDCIIIRSRAKAALRLKFEVCKELSNHMELLPKTGYIQAQSSFSVQLKFLPRHSLPEDAGKYFDTETRVLEVPMTIKIADKTKPVEFIVHAIVTTSDLEISPAEVNFGYCTIYEAVQTTITLTNKSILPQEFGFVGLPEFVEIQPSDGFGTLLPLERLNLDIIFKANKAKEYSFELTCKSEINRQFKLSCKAVGVHPPLELSHSLVKFAATALNDVSTATLYVINAHVSLNRFTHAVPRIGKGEIAPVGPTSFEFLVPEDSPVTIMPSVGTVLPGKKCLIQVYFRPVLSEQLIREEAVQMLCRADAQRMMLKKIRESEMQFFETLDIRSIKATLTLSITGHGVAPSIACSVEGEVLDMGYVIAKEKVTSTFKIQNTSTLPLRYSIELESLSQTRDKEQQRLPFFITSPPGRTDFVGTQNYSGLSVFNIFPVEGGIEPRKSQDFTVTFSPDHESLYYSDCLKVVLFGKEIARVIWLKGAARNHMMFVEGGDPLDVPVESLAITSPMSEEAAKGELEEPAKPLLLSLEYIQAESSGTPAVRELKIGAIRTAQFASKKNVEFSLDNLPLLQQKGFTIEPVKGTVDRGQIKCISVSWVPPADFDVR